MPQKIYHRIQIILIVFIILCLVSGCRLPWQPQPEVATQVIKEPVVQFTPTPTREPRTDLPPALVEVRPFPFSVIGLNESITIYFNQAMDYSAVEAALHFEPRISGRFEWEDSRTLTFFPDQQLEAGSYLTLAIDTTAQAANQKNLPDPVELNFQVADHLQTIQVMPVNGTQDVDPESVIFVAFNQPVVHLGEESSSEPGFSLSPEVPGRGVWLNTSTYVFTPEPGMSGGTTYTIALNKNLTATSGATMSSNQAFEYHFSTKQPEIEKVLPMYGELLSLDGPVKIFFNMRMNTQSVEENFSLTDARGTKVAGKFEWESNDRHLVFTPDSLLERDATYIIRLKSEARSAGGLPILVEINTPRHTYSDFGVNTSVVPKFESYYAGFGAYEIDFSAPLDDRALDENIQLTPEVAGVRFFAASGERTLLIYGYFRYETTYTLRLDPKLKDIWGGELAEAFETTFTTPPAAPSLNLASGYLADNLMFIPASTPELILQATNINSLSLEVAPISVEDLITLLHPDNYRYREIFLPEVREVTTHQLALSSNQREVLTLPLSYQGDPLASGIYYLGIQTPDIPAEENEHYQKYFLIVSENNLVMKISPEQVFVWATRLDDFTPLGDAPVTVYNAEGDILVRGKINSEGQFIGEFPRIEEPYDTYFALAGTPGEADFGFSISTWQEIFQLYEQGIPYDFLPDLLDAYIYTDRPVYRPGDTIHFKTIVFSRDDGLLAFPAFDSVTVTLQGDPGVSGRSATIYSEDLPLSRFGTAVGSVDLSEEIPTGYYWIDVSVDETLIKTLFLDVAAYRKPEIDLAVRFTDEALLAGEKIIANTWADYYFGLPAADTNFSWSFYIKDGDFSLPGYQVGPLPEFWSRLYYPEYSPWGEVMLYGEGVTDGAGQSTLSFTATDYIPAEGMAGGLKEYSLEVTVMDESGFPVSMRDSLLVHPETFYIGVKPGSYFGTAGSLFEFSVFTVDWNKEPVSQIELEATFESIHWDVKETGNPEKPFEYVEVTRLIGGASPVSNREGKAQIGFTPPDPGTYRLTLKADHALTQVLVWIGGESGAIWPVQSYNQIELIPDLDEYQPGQVAQVFIPNPFTQGSKALVTIERGSVLSSQIFDISGSGTTVSVPITEESIPNLYVSAILLGKDAADRPDYRQGTIVLPVSRASKTLNMELQVEPQLTEPGENVSLKLKITDHAGNPIQGEFSVSVVDKALLALVPPNTLPIIDAIYQDTPLSVQTSFSLYTYVKQFSVVPLDIGGLGGGADGLVETGIREDFPDTAFWQANVITGVDGTAQLVIPLPDSLTTWVVEARGLSDTFLVGQAEVEVKTQKPLMIRPVTPRFLVDGDQVELAAIVHNNTDEALQVDVTLAAEGFTLNDANSLQRVTIDPGRSQHVAWWGTVESVDAIALVFQAVGGIYSDASTSIWGDLPVKRYTMPHTFSTAGQLVEASERLEVVSLPITSAPSSGELVLTLNPSLLASLVEGLEALEDVPYDDTVSVLSRLLANLNAYLVLQNLDLATGTLAASLEQVTSSGINHLLSIQNYDGGWSWWGTANIEDQKSSPFITAYVLLGLEMVNQAGIEINESSITRARDYLVFELKQPDDVEAAWMLDELTFLVYALRNHDLNLTPTIDDLYARRTELSPWALGLLALTIREQGGMVTRSNTLIADIESRAIRSATGVHWESERAYWMLPGTPVFNTAAVIYTLAQLDPASTSLSPGLVYLMSHRNAQGLWSSSFESAWVLMAVTRAIEGTGDYLADYTFQADLNEKAFVEGRGTGPESIDTVIASAPISSLYADAPNTLLIQKGEGAGTLYFRVDLNTYQPAANAPAINRGINLQRDYYLAAEGCPGAEDCVPIDSVSLSTDNPAQFITVVLTVNLPNGMYNLMVEDCIPAGTEIINPRFSTSPIMLEGSGGLFDPRSPFASGWGWWYFDQPQIYDDHILWTAEYVPAGTYLLVYNLLPYQRGTYQVLPAHAWQMFYPEVQGTSAGNRFIIK